ncbi:GTP-binding protein rhoA [Smittium mucronatum]|uniref:GTP-binding protein rhoA n=1 Tax=Smittium mucronatum TaxID=133383 RepID=A0A1R0H0G7_9FUNG|nr:GTP-binding protein rhoA [Smittium mucronatum]
MENMEIDGRKVDLVPWDTIRDRDFDRLRYLSLTDSEVWISEASPLCPAILIILVGCKKDLRGDPVIIEELGKCSLQPVSTEQVGLLFLLSSSFNLL